MAPCVSFALTSLLLATRPAWNLVSAEGPEKRGGGGESHDIPGHPIHTIRLHRYDHSGLESMLEKEARWHQRLPSHTIIDRGGGGGQQQEEHASSSASSSSFVELSAIQTTALKRHHEEHRLAVVDKSTTRSAPPGRKGARHEESSRLSPDVPPSARDPETPAPAVVRMVGLSSQYVGPIGIGTATSDCEASGRSSSECVAQAQSVQWVIYDTGSTNIWVVSDLCTSEYCRAPGMSVYDHTLSQTYRDLPDGGVYLDIEFGTGKLSGPQGRDDVHVGPFTVKQQVFGLIEQKVGEAFRALPFEGILGLSFPSMAAAGSPSFFENLINQRLLHQNVIALYLSPTDRSNNAMFWGGVDPRVVGGPMYFFDVINEHYWSLELVSLAIGSEIFLDSRTNTRPHHGAATSSPRAILDSGTTYLTAESGVFEKIVSRLPDMPCGEMTDSSHPPLTISLRDVDGVIRPFVLERHQYMVIDNDGRCWPAVMRIDLPVEQGPGIVLGDTFLKVFVSLYDRGDGTPGVARVGLAPARHGSEVEDRIRELTKDQVKFERRPS